jgi:hypothetical protein
MGIEVSALHAGRDVGLEEGPRGCPLGLLAPTSTVRLAIRTLSTVGTVVIKPDIRVAVKL